MKKKKSKEDVANSNTISGKGKKICIATPMYGGMCHGAYSKSVLHLVLNSQALGYKVAVIDLYNESLITRARDVLTEVFLRGDSTHLLWIDADQEFDPIGVIKMIQEDVDVIAAPVPLKGINWDAIESAAAMGEKNLKRFSPKYNFNLVDKGLQTLDKSVKHEVHDAGTGLMLIKREVLENLKPLVRSYILNGNPVYGIKKGDTISSFWNTGFDDEHNVYLSEDYMFCKLFKSIGGKIWIAPYVVVAHYGTYGFI